MHITITGKLGSGKSTICNLLRDTHGFQTYSTGAIHREIALQNKVSTLDMNQLMAKDHSYDNAIDSATTRISLERKDETVIFDSRMAWNFAVNSFKVFVAVDPLAAAERIINNPRGEEEVYADLEDARQKLAERSRLENERFIAIYGVDYYDYANYNLIIDSTYATPAELAEIIYGKFRVFREANRESGREANNIFISPFSFYPLAAGKDISSGRLNQYIENKEYLRSPVSAIALEGYHYIIDGHHRVLAAIHNNERFIDAKIADADLYPALQSKQNLLDKIQAAGISALHEFEKAGEFHYKSYPRYYAP